MRARDLERLYDYHYWANARLYAVLSRLPAEAFTQSLAGSYESIRNTLVHSLSAEWGWLDRCGGPKRGPKLDPVAYPTVDELVRTASHLESLVRGFLAGMADEDLLVPIEFSIAEGPTYVMPRGELLQHAAIHAVHHRGQVSLLIRALGHAPGDVDFLFYLAERPLLTG